MAESANFAQNLQNLPSVFEISAAEVLDNLLYPALSKLFDFIGLKYTFKINKKHFSDDVSPFVIIALQYIYLKNRGGSLGESFYGLQRVSPDTGELLSHRKQILSASILTFVPYFEKKLRDRIAQHEQTKWEDYCMKALHVYKAVKAVHTFLYLTKNSLCHSPLFRFLGLGLRYPKEAPNEDRSTFLILRTLEFFAFFLQFIQWWYANKGEKIGSLPDPEPINKTSLDRRKHPPGTCPICLQKISNPTACSVSGYVFCWKCIANHLKDRKHCPVSGYPIGIEDLVRIYDD